MIAKRRLIANCKDAHQDDHRPLKLKYQLLSISDGHP